MGCGGTIGSKPWKPTLLVSCSAAIPAVKAAVISDPPHEQVGFLEPIRTALVFYLFFSDCGVLGFIDMFILDLDPTLEAKSSSPPLEFRIHGTIDYCFHFPSPFYVFFFFLSLFLSFFLSRLLLCYIHVDTVYTWLCCSTLS
jgi:hypothetical protein